MRENSVDMEHLGNTCGTAENINRTNLCNIYKNDRDGGTDPRRLRSERWES